MTFRDKYDSASTWLEKVVVMNLYHKINESTVRATGKYFDVAIGTVSENLKLARHHPLIKDAPSRIAALRMIRS